MPLLALFSKKNRSSSKVSTVPDASSNVSLNDEDYVSVASPSVTSHYTQPSASSSKLALPFRRKFQKAVSEDHSHTHQHSDPLIDPPPPRSSLFQHYQDDQKSTRSLPGEPDHKYQQQRPSQSPGSPKKPLFGWGSHKEHGKSISPTKAGTSEPDTSFNLKSFRHVRPDSPSLGSSKARSPSPAPALHPIPTTAFPSPPVAFQVTSRRPRADSYSELTTPGSSPITSQQKMAAGAFRQAARRSSTSLSLTDSPTISPIRTSLDDRPPVSLLPPPQAAGETPSRPKPPSSTYTPKPTASPLPSSVSSPFPSSVSSTISPPSSNLSSLSPSRSTQPPSLKFTSVAKPSRTRTNAFGDSSSSSSSSEEEEEEEDSTSDAAVGTPRVSRRRTITQNKGQAQALPPLISSVRQQILRATPPTTTSSVIKDSSSTDDLSRPQSSLSVYGTGPRPRASLSVGALTPTAKETRANIALAANARVTSTAARPLTRNVGSDTSESSDSEEDAPLSSLMLPRRPGTSQSSHSSPSTMKKPLVDLNAPSTLTGRPVKAPPPFARDEGEQQRSKIDAGRRSRPLLAPVSQSTRNLQVPPSRDSWLSQDTSSNSRISQTPSSRTTTSFDTRSFSDNSGRISSIAHDVASGASLNLTGNTASLSPVPPPARPFARRESPASSTGDSSSGRAPLTPRDGSETRSTHSKPSAMSGGRGRPSSHGRKASVTFEDDKDGGGKDKQKDNVTAGEARRKERRRSEARAAIELGNVVNGPPPVDDDDLAAQQHLGMQGGWPQAGMQMPMQMQMPPVPPMFNMGMSMPTPGGYGMGYPPPLPSPDPAFLAAHQQAMAIAKQTFQYAVAQQALAAANDEWERSSTMTGYGGPAVAPPWGYGMGVRQSVMLPPTARSMYAGSIGGASGGWGGTGSVYGNAFGNAAGGGRNSTFSQVDLSAGAQRPVRPRTKTAPSAASPPAGIPTSRMPAPPSSFRGIKR